MTSQILKSGFYKNTRILKFWEWNIIFSSNKKKHQVHIKGYFMTTNSFAEVTFKAYKNRLASHLRLK